MSLSFKNMLSTVNGISYYADSIDISESLPIEEGGALGTDNTTMVASGPVEGTVNIGFYITTGAELSNLMNLRGSTGFLNVQAGPLQTNNAILNSFSVEGDSLNMVKGSISCQYYGQIQSGSAPSTPAPVTILPAHGALSVASVGELGAAGCLSFSYSFSQTPTASYAIGEGTLPVALTMSKGEIDIGIETISEDVNFNQSNLTGASGLCPETAGQSGLSVKSVEISVRNLCDEVITGISASGYITDRSITPQSNAKTTESFAIKGSFVKPDEC